TGASRRAKTCATSHSRRRNSTHHERRMTDPISIPVPAIPPLDSHSRDALLEGRHGDPHQVLGPRAATIGGVAGVLVRVLQPAAADCWVVLHGVVTALRPEGDGFFAGFFPGATMPFRYHLRFITEDG